MGPSTAEGPVVLRSLLARTEQIDDLREVIRVLGYDAAWEPVPPGPWLAPAAASSPAGPCPGSPPPPPPARRGPRPAVPPPAAPAGFPIFFWQRRGRLAGARRYLAHRLARALTARRHFHRVALHPLCFGVL